MTKNNSTIVMPTDLSDLSWTALEPAAELARLHNLKLAVVAFVPVLSKLSLAGFGAGNAMETLTKLEEDELEATKKAMDEKLATLKNVEVEAHAIPGNDVTYGILGFAKEHNARVIVIATHGRTGLAHAFLGSTTEKVVRRSEVPVMTIPSRRSPLACKRSRTAAQYTNDLGSAFRLAVDV